MRRASSTLSAVFGILFGRIVALWNTAVFLYSPFTFFPCSSFTSSSMERKIEDAWKMTQLATCSVVGLLDRYRIKATIKWPNDIYVDGKKICGILVETILDPDLKGVIVGIGLNVNNEDFQSMKQITHKEYKISKLAIGLKTFMLIYYNLYQTNQFHKVLEYANSISYLKDQWVEYGDYGEVCFIVVFYFVVEFFAVVQFRVFHSNSLLYA